MHVLYVPKRGAILLQVNAIPGTKTALDIEICEGKSDSGSWICFEHPFAVHIVLVLVARAATNSDHTRVTLEVCQRPVCVRSCIVL